VIFRGKGLCFTVLDYVSHEPILVARIDIYKEPTTLDPEVEGRGLNLRDKALEAAQMLPQAPGGTRQRPSQHRVDLDSRRRVGKLR
jgi:hypothetical protein